MPTFLVCRVCEYRAADSDAVIRAATHILDLEEGIQEKIIVLVSAIFYC